jgi:hypothetical protein
LKAALSTSRSSDQALGRLVSISAPLDPAFAHEIELGWRASQVVRLFSRRAWKAAAHQCGSYSFLLILIAEVNLTHPDTRCSGSAA